MSDKRSSTRSRVKARKVAPFEALLLEKARLDGELLSRLKKDLPKLEALLAKASDGLRYEDYIYRFTIRASRSIISKAPRWRSWPRATAGPSDRSMR